MKNLTILIYQNMRQLIGSGVFLGRFFTLFLFSCVLLIQVNGQVAIQINSGNPNFPFPQFLDYTGGKSLASNNPVGVPHAEMEQRIRDAYQILTNNMTYNINKNGAYGTLNVAGVKYIQPQDGAGGNGDISSCTCEEGDGYYLLAAAYMADQPTFNGYYMWMHDRQLQKTQRFVDCAFNSSGYNYSAGISGAGSAGASTNVYGGGLSGNSATDGDVDIALALLVAWQQWGDSASICINPCTGKKVYYSTEAIKFIKALVDTSIYTPSLPIKTYITGDIGMDGYHKGGDSWNETTSWASGGYLGLKPQVGSPQTNYADYAAPAYFRSFGDILAAKGQSPWCINQYRRAEASDDWLVGQAYAQGLIPFIGKYGVSGTTATFANFAGGEDFRFGWRTILNYVWNGAPLNTWDPVNHVANAGSNAYEYNMGVRFAGYLKNPQGTPYNNAVETHNTLNYCGPPTSLDANNTTGTAMSEFPLNWIHGTGAPAAIVGQDFDLMAQMFRECIIRWDQYDASGGTSGAQLYLTSRPRYFHEWFRLLGMLVLSGNYHDPLDFTPSANVKIYKSVNKTYAYPGDIITYKLNWRNYGKVTANGIVIRDSLANGITIQSSNKSYTVSGNVITWNIGNLTGFSTGGLNLTQDSLTYTVLVGPTAPALLKQNATITSSNGGSWVSNAYPNNQTSTMQRNWVDILNLSPLGVTITPSKTLVNPGDTLSYTITFSDQSVPFLNGGRQGVIVAFATEGLSTSASSPKFKYRIYHGAHEALINYADYRVSYYLNKPGPPTWNFAYNVCEGVPGLNCSTNPTFSQETLVAGTGYNHRFILTFPTQLATITPFLYFYAGQTRYIHQGAVYPQRLVMQVNASGSPSYDWTTDWSYQASVNGAADGDPYFPVANDWTDETNLNIPVQKYTPNSCTNNVTTNATNVLVEQWDGYTWRRVYGNAPVSGRALTNAQLTSLIPAAVTFGGWSPGYPTGTVSGALLTWSAIPAWEINQSQTYKFWVTVKNSAYFGCGSTPNPAFFVATAIGTALNESAVSVTTTVGVTCTPIIPAPTPITSMSKKANKSTFANGDIITYTIGYRQTQGQVVSGTTSSANWTDRSGNGLLGVSSNTISLNSAGSQTRYMTNNYSYGTNGTLMGTMTIGGSGAQYQSYSIMARYNGSSWVNIVFNVQYANIQISVVSMPSGTTIGSAVPSPTYLGLPGPFDYKIQLNNSTVSIWVVQSGSPITGSATYIQTGLPVQSGYAGVYTNQNQPAGLSNWYSNLDGAFNLQLTDAVPLGVTFGSASNAVLTNCPSCTGAPITGSLTSGIVTYKTIPGPVTYGDSLTFIWTGTVTSCPTNGQIVNTAYMNLYGINPSPGAQVISTCTSAPLSLVESNITAVKQQDGGVLVSWAYANESGISGYMLEKSKGQGEFKSLYGTMVNPSFKGRYTFSDLDNADQDLVWYYRVKVFNSDGSISYSQIVSIIPNGQVTVLAYPNPFEGTFNLTINANTTDGMFDINVRDLTGKAVYNLVNAKLNVPLVLGNGLSAGVYLVNISGEGYNKTLKLEKLE